MITYIGDHKDEFWFEPIFNDLPIAPQIYYAARAVFDAATGLCLSVPYPWMRSDLFGVCIPNPNLWRRVLPEQSSF